MKNNRFGEWLVNHDVIRIGQLVEALKIQVEYDINEKKHVLLGDILVEDLNLLSKKDVEQYIQDWRREEGNGNS